MGWQDWQRRLTLFRESPPEMAFAATLHASRLALLSYSRWQLKQSVPLDFLNQRPNGALGSEYVDLWYLYDLVRRTKPRKVLEFGSGCSTVVIGYALRDNEREGGPDGRILSLDADEHWASVTQKTLPPEVEKYIRVVASGLEVVEINGTRAYVHTAPYDNDPDLLYLDGPALGDVRVAADVLNIEEHLPPGFQMVVDGRVENVAFLRRNLKRNYLVRERHVSFNTLFKLLD